MNFHISPLSPLRPQFSGSLSPSSSAARRDSPFGPDDTNHDTVGSVGQPKIEVDGVEADDELASSATGSGSGSGSGSDSDISADDITQDSRDVLVQRLNDLAQRLSGADVRTENIEALHAQVDAMEKLLSRRAHRSPARLHRTPSSSSARRSASLQPGASSRPRSLVLPAAGDGRDALGIMAPMSPSWLRSHFQRRPSTHRDRPDETSDLHKAAPVPVLSAQQLQPAEATATATATFSSSPKISSEMADSIVLEAENLCAEMSSVIESLQKRREESDHLHAVSIEREEAANERLRQQEARIHELEEAVEEDESELRYLKIQLRAIETQCAGYVPPGADPELEQSIRFWKRDWEELRDKWAARRGTLLRGREDESGSFSGLTSPSSAR
ncbi:hypothetical protein KVR01_005987 [Diaporthe batatas]|uniref:uncharacterized protein n=1 Tax=Diaporthe batatas TaxID=748121 RepID=UPI001D0427A4|nr:uncharacterized protein KVR01_005987 [Diaporthe batatas]KAG8164069.1 hypothetical protein KVR01_005987 [Diaporthe batatas]